MNIEYNRHIFYPTVMSGYVGWILNIVAFILYKQS